MQKSTYLVSGMHCASCRTIIEKKLQQLPGVNLADVNLVNNSVRIDYDQAICSLTDMNNAVAKYGYSISEKPAQPTTNGELKKQLISLFIIGAIGILLLFHMYYEYFYLPNNPIDQSTLSQVESVLYMAFLHYLPLLLASYVLFFHGQQYVLGLYRFFRGDSANMDSLIGLSVVSAYIYSLAITIFSEFLTIDKELLVHFYDVVVFVILFISIGKFLETWGKLSTRSAVGSLLKMQVKSAFLEIGSELKEVKLEELKIGDIVLIKAGMLIPIDGLVISGHSFVDESSFNGEAIPVEKTVNSNAIAGTLNGLGVLRIRVSSEATDTMLNKIIKIVEEAQASKASIEKYVDKIAAVFIPIVMAITLAVFIIWLTFGSHYLGYAKSWSIAFVSAMSILAVACPCAIGLATPMALIMGIGSGARMGIIFKRAESLEKIRLVTKLFTDKTGTITEGKLKVNDFIVLDKSVNALDLLASLEANSTHPIAVAMYKYAVSNGFNKLPVDNFNEQPGIGVTGVVNGKKYRVISLQKAIQLGLSYEIGSQYIQNEKAITLALIDDKSIISVAFLQDNIKAEAKYTIENLKKNNIETVIFTGDNKFNAEKVALAVGVDEYHAELNPIEKMDFIKQAQAKGNKVAMLGDGVNDAPAISLSDAGVAMSAGSDAAINSADLILLNGDLSKFLLAFKLSKKTFATIKRNLIWAFLFNITAIPMAAGVLYPFFGILLNPIYSSMLMAVSSFFVVFSSLSLKFTKLNP